MSIIELCGLPGVGKSTLLNVFRKTYHEIEICIRDDLLSHNKVIRKTNTVVQSILFQAGIRYPNEKPLYDFISEYPDAELYFCVRLIDLYRKLQIHKYSKCPIVLEEGPIQYLSSIPFDQPIMKSKSLNESLDILRPNSFTVVFCECSIETSISRIQSRDKQSDRYKIKNYQRLFTLLSTKLENLHSIIDSSPFNISYIDMERPVRENVESLHQIIMQT